LLGWLLGWLVGWLSGWLLGGCCPRGEMQLSRSSSLGFPVASPHAQATRKRRKASNRAAHRLARVSTGMPLDVLLDVFHPPSSLACGVGAHNLDLHPAVPSTSFAESSVHHGSGDHAAEAQMHMHAHRARFHHLEQELARIADSPMQVAWDNAFKLGTGFSSHPIPGIAFVTSVLKHPGIVGKGASGYFSDPWGGTEISFPREDIASKMKVEGDILDGGIRLM